MENQHIGPRLGAHMSIAKGLELAFMRGQQVGCDTIQIFTHNSNQWQSKPLTGEDIAAFHKARVSSGIAPVISHNIYLINLASPELKLYDKSINAFWEEMQRAEALGIPYLVFHPGSHMGTDEDAGLQRIAKALDELLTRGEHFKLELVVETTAGQGTQLGHNFEQLARLLTLIQQPQRLGICLDTSHIFAAGYDIGTAQGYASTWGTFEHLIGWPKLKILHLNDSKKGLGSRIDRHQHIGQGHLGLEPFSWLINDPRLQHVPMILETPKGISPDAEDMDLVNLRNLRELVRT
jgi:deoxyribonuclease-4